LVAEFVVELLARFGLGVVKHHEQGLGEYLPELVEYLADDHANGAGRDAHFAFRLAGFLLPLALRARCIVFERVLVQ